MTRLLMLTPVMLALLIVSTQSAAQAPKYEEALAEMGKIFAAEAKKRRLQRIAVSTFTDLEGQPTALGRFIADELTHVLAQESSVEVVDRQQVLQLFKELHVASPASPSPSELTKLGQTAKIDAVITGSVVELSDTIHLSAKLIGTRTAAVVRTAKATVPKVGVLAELSQGLAKRGGAEAPKGGDLPPAEKDATPPQGMVLIPAGAFIYGEGETQQNLTLPAFWMDMFEVTNDDYTMVRGYTFDAAQANHPVTQVTWKDAQLFCETIGKRLPSEQEWEKAARGTDGRRYPWGDVFEPERGNAQNRLKGTTPVGQFPDGRSPYDLQDMAGNVMEWTGSEEQGAKVFRGGSWASPAEEVRATYRNRMGASHELFDLGFRCAKEGPR